VSILGDTSYGECCVDEVAAEHIEADAVIHFGNACLTPTRFFFCTGIIVHALVLPQRD
jgi:diphthamide biosynthesis protein 2